jgi:hypothetical protein
MKRLFTCPVFHRGQQETGDNCQAITVYHFMGMPLGHIDLYELEWQLKDINTHPQQNGHY